MLRTLKILYLLGVFIGTCARNTIYRGEPKIIGGQIVDILFQPYMVNFVIVQYRGTVSTPNQYYLRAGSNHVHSGGTLHEVSKIHVYDNSTVANLMLHDIALLEVRPPFQFSHTTHAIQIANEDLGLPSKLLTCGWGRIRQDEWWRSDDLRCVEVPHVPYEQCRKIFPSILNKDYHLCYGSQGRDSCYGDSGGPVAGYAGIYGIASFGRGCGAYPGVYVKISYYQKWITKTASLHGLSQASTSFTSTFAPTGPPWGLWDYLNKSINYNHKSV